MLHASCHSISENFRSSAVGENQAVHENRYIREEIRALSRRLGAARVHRQKCDPSRAHTACLIIIIISWCTRGASDFIIQRAGGRICIAATVMRAREDASAISPQIRITHGQRGRNIERRGREKNYSGCIIPIRIGHGLHTRVCM